MNEEEARELLKEAYSKIDWLNLPRVLQTQGEFQLHWKKFDNAYFRPNYTRFDKDIKWLEKNMSRLLEAIAVLREIK